MRKSILFIGIGCFVGAFAVAMSTASAASVSVKGKAESLNTDNSYLDFSNYNSNVAIDTATGLFTGYAFAEDIGWVAFGTTDNASGPVTVDLLTGQISGKARVLNTQELLDFDTHNSNVEVNLSSGVFSGYVFSTDIGWYNFADPGVNTVNTSLDSTPPQPFQLESPQHQSYTSMDRPDFRWKTATDSTSSISKYVLEIDNGETGDFTVDNIPPSSPTDIVTSKYTIQYQGFADTNDDNNYINIHTHSSSDWSTSQNDGALREGKRTWSVKAQDTNGNTRIESRILFVDYTSPTASISSVNNTAVSSTYTTTDTTPTFSGKIADPLSGDTDTTKVASGPKSVEIKIERADPWGNYSLYSISTIHTPDMYWSADNLKITQSTENTSDKYATFVFTPDQALVNGKYRVLTTGRDRTDRVGSSSQLILTIGSTTSPLYPTVSPSEPIAETPRPIGTTQTSTPAPTQTPAGTRAPISVNEPAGPSLLTRIVEWSHRAFGWFKFETTSFLAYWGGSVHRDYGLATNILNYLRNVSEATVQMIAAVLKTPTLIATRMQTWIAYSTGAFGEIVLNQEPTRITDVRIVEVGRDYAIVEWNTNHFTKNNKINWGETTEYGAHAFAEDFQKKHTVKLEGLKPGVAYKFEVMSQNKNYVYDSFHEFVTKPQ